MSLKNLALFMLASALVLGGCECGSSPPVNTGKPGVAKKLAFTVQPSKAAAGAALAPAVQVTVQDVDGKPVPGAKATVTVALKDNPAGGTLSGAAPVEANGAVASFAGLSVDKAGEGYTLVAHAEGLEDATSQAFAIEAGAARQLAFADEPGDSEAGGLLTPLVRVAVRDAQGNPVQTGTPITVALGANPSEGTLSGTLTVTSTGGVALFSELSLDKAGEGYTLVASAPGLDAITSHPFRVKPGKPKALAFVTQPSRVAAGQAVSPAVQVRLVDGHGNTVTATDSVTVALGSNSTGATLGGTLTVAAVDGVATFADLSVDQVGSYTLVASSGSLDGATSDAFDVTAGAAVQLAFRVQPVGAVAGVSFTPAVEVVALDARGNVASGFSGPVVVALEGNPTGDTLHGTLAANAVGGVAVFDSLSLTRVGSGYTLAAGSSGLAPAASLPFDVTAGAAARLTYAVQPSSVGAGVVLSPPVQVRVEDAFGNTVTSSSASVSVVLTGGTPGAVLGGSLTVNAVGGVATFSNLAVDRQGTGYALLASAPGLTGAISAAFEILHGAPTKLAFLVQPGNTTSGSAIAPAVKVVIQDANGDTATSSTLAVTVQLGANAAGGTLAGTRTVSAVGGVATFADLSLDKAGTGYTLAASASGLASAISSAFDVTAGAASRLAFRTQPTSAAAGVALSPALEVAVLDAAGNLTGSTASVTLALGNNPGNATLSGSASVNAVAGVATFPGLSLDKAGTGYTLAAGASGLTGDTSAPFDIRAAAPSRLAFQVQPSNAPAGVALSPAVVVRIEDAFGNRTDSTASIAVELGNNPAGATLSGTLAVAAVAGEATFSTLSLDKAAAGYTLVASSPGLSPATSGGFDISASAAAQLAFAVQPSTVAAGVAMTPAVEVTLLDALGNRTNSTASVTLALGSNPGGASLSGTTTVNAVNGKATFSGLSLDKVGTGYTLTASSAGVALATSSAFDVTAGAAAKLAFTVQPSSVAAGNALTPAVEVSVLDAFDNLTASTASVTLALDNNPGGASLSGTKTVGAVAGVARFPGLSLDKVGAGYTLAASASGLTGATSGAFDVTPGAPAQLVFRVQPSNAAAGAVLSPAVQVAVQDAFGNAVPSASNSVTVAFGNNPGGGALGGTLSVAASGGVASFDTLSVRKAATGYTLVASSPGLTSSTSAAFDISASTAERLAFRVQPSNVAAGDAIAPAVEVAVEDAFGNTVLDSNASVTVALGTSSNGGTLSGSLQQSAVNGVARFDSLSLTQAGKGYTLLASSTGLTSVGSNPFDVTAGAAAKLAFSVQPSNVAAGASITPAVQVTVQDAYGNTVTGGTQSITVAIGNNPSSGTLSGSLSVSASGGSATFTGLSLDKAGTGYTLTASSSGLSSATSNAFNVTAGAAAKLAFTVQPTDVTAGASITPAVQVSVQDAFGNTVTSATNSITVAIGNNPGVGILNGATTVSAVAGVATFPGLSITKTGDGYTLKASATGLTTATSAGFNVTPGAATSISFYTNPPNVVTAGVAISPSVKVGVRDAYNNTVTASSAAITLSLSANPGGSTLGGTLTVNAVNGVAVFPDLTLDKAANNYRFAAASPGLTGNTSALFNVTAGAAKVLAFTTQPATVAAGATFSPSVAVTVRDAFGNTVTSPAVSVDVALGNNPGGATLSGTTTVTTSNGVATFSTLTLDKVGTGYTLVASSATLTSATSNAFDVTAGAATQLAFTVQPTSTTAGTALSPAVQVSVRDAGGNLVTSSTASITLALANNPGGGTLSGTTTVSASGGVASFPGLSLAKVGTGYTLSASATGLAASTSAPFDITAGAAAKLAFTVQPSTGAPGEALSPAVQVSVQDAFGNTSSSAANVTLALGTNPSAATLGGTLTVAASGGVATFADVTVDKLGTGYTLTASAPGLTGATSAAFNVVSTGGRLVYTDPATSGAKIALVRDAASTNGTVVLNLVALVDLTGYYVGMNLPLDSSLVQANAALLTPGTALPAGTSPTAAYGKLPSSGPLAGVLTTGQSQKASGPGAVAGDTLVPAGSVLYTVRLDMKAGAPTGVVFNGAALGPKFRALLRDKLGADVVASNEFAIGRLEVQ